MNTPKHQAPWSEREIKKLDPLNIIGVIGLFIATFLPDWVVYSLPAWWIRVAVLGVSAALVIIPLLKTAIWRESKIIKASTVINYTVLFLAQTSSRLEIRLGIMVAALAISVGVTQNLLFRRQSKLIKQNAADETASEIASEARALLRQQKSRNPVSD